METWTIIGVDCATDPKNVGLAQDIWENGGGCITDITNGQLHSADEILGAWVSASRDCLLAMDVPLGWPDTKEPTKSNRAEEFLLGCGRNWARQKIFPCRLKTRMRSTPCSAYWQGETSYQEKHTLPMIWPGAKEGWTWVKKQR